MKVISATVLGLALAAFFTTVRSNEAQGRRPRDVPGISGVVVAPSYSDLRALRRGQNAGLYDGAIATFAGELRDAGPDGALSPEQRALRAYEGAPPVVPHPIAEDSVSECLACHESGALVLGRAAPRMNHPRRESCTQCHVPDTAREREGTDRPAPPPLSANRFEGHWSLPPGEPR